MKASSGNQILAFEVVYFVYTCQKIKKGKKKNSQNYQQGKKADIERYLAVIWDVFITQWEIISPKFVFQLGLKVNIFPFLA